jgi:hypothetical protein
MTFSRCFDAVLHCAGWIIATLQFIVFPVAGGLLPLGVEVPVSNVVVRMASEEDAMKRVRVQCRHFGSDPAS